MTKDEALKMALEALEKLAKLGNGDTYGNSIGNVIAQDAITAVKEAKEALAHPEQEPAAWMTDYRNIMHAKEYSEWLRFDGGKGCERFSDYVIPLYTSPPKRQPLTDEQIDNLGRKEKDALLDFIYENGTASEGSDYFFKKYARVILAAGCDRRKWVELSATDIDNITHKAISIVDAMLLTEEILKELNK